MKPCFLAAAAALLVATAPAGAQSVTLTHVHGLAFTADGKQLFIPSHHGLAIYSEGKWSVAPGPRHDYMGFAASEDRFYSSGHPAPGSGLVDPFGLMRSRDGGRTWDKLGLQGESDFHVLAVGYRTNAVYVFNPVPNSRMKTPGIYSTQNDGFGWVPAAARGLAGQIVALAAHPTDARRCCDHSRRRVRLEGQRQFVRAARRGRGLCGALRPGRPTPVVLRPRQRATPGPRRARRRGRDEIKLPSLARDAVAYIAQSQATSGVYAIATFERSVYLTADGGKTWRRIAERGRTE
ncbi:MAG: glycosyl hydrolase [Burkholderiales bacterium]|nr:glycosyl hydrolase [Burkholderiales bacterium]